MDEKDESILKVLGRRSGLSSRALSKMLDIPIPTVHRRVKKMEKEGVIIGYKALVNYEKTTWPIGALLLINLSEAVPGKGPIPKKEVLRTLRVFDEIEEIIEVQATDFDLVVRVRFRSLRKLSEFIEKLRYVEGIEETSSAIITEETVLPPHA
ncbi:MAG: Lrp/AsnC family transcriptional regulator [Candidatus Bathyarchaeota archaeon]|nr:Lrp/AsnC family transcriptional regulator [Candidatus Bathyarchaeota archaeon]